MDTFEPIVLLPAWRQLAEACTAAGRPFLRATQGTISRLRQRLDLPEDVIALLQLGTPVEPLVVGDRRLLIQWAELADQLDAWGQWPRHLLPFGAVGGAPAAATAILAMDMAHGGACTVAVSGWQSQGAPGTVPALSVCRDVPELLRDLRAWVECDASRHQHFARAFAGLDELAWRSLDASLGPTWPSRWLFASLRPLAEVRAVLAAERRAALLMNRGCAVVMALAPCAGWWAGQQVAPPQPWQGLGLAMLVLGGVPSWLYAHTRQEHRALSRLLSSLPQR